MERMTSARLFGREVFFNFSVGVMFDAVEKFGSAAAMLERMQEEGRESFEATVWAAERMQRDAEAIRRENGERRTKLLTERELSRGMYPAEFAELKNAVTAAVINGYKRETDPEDEGDTDAALEELEGKKERAGG